MVLVLCLSLLPITVLAASNSYVALGDSITTGYGLEGEQSFAEIVADKNGYDLNILAEDGATSEELLGVVTAPANAETLKNAGLITITIGGNDLMGALYQYLADVYNTTNETAFTGEDMQLALMGKHPTITQNIALFYLGLNLNGFVTFGMDSTLSEFKTNLSGILGQLKELNPTAQIIVTNQYNPYGILVSIENYKALAEQFEAGIAKLNNVISEVCESLGVTVADVHTSFAEALDAGENPCNASVAGGTINPDFHPNAYGHGLIAAAITAKLPETPEPEPDPEVEPNIYVGGVGLYGDKNTTAYAQTDENGQVITQGATASNYNISWNGETLTLNNANIQGGYTYIENEWEKMAAIYCASDLKIELAKDSDNQVKTVDDDRFVFGICSLDGSIAISGDGALEVTATGTYSNGISSRYGGITISSGTLTITTTGQSSTGIDTSWFNDITIAGGTVNINVDGETSYGICASVGGITISGGTVDVTATGENSFGIYNTYLDGSIMISGGTVTVIGGLSQKITVAPPDGKAIQVKSGADAASSMEVIGSPFNSECTFENKDEYFYSQVVDPAGDAANLYIGGVGLYGDKTSLTMAYAKTDENGQVTTQNASESDYNIKWDGETLTLNKANILTLNRPTAEGEYTAIYCEESFDIDLIDTNIIAVTGAKDNDITGILAEKDMSISGDGRLKVTASRGINVFGNVTISGGTVTAMCDSDKTGIRALGDIIITGGTVTATGGKGGIQGLGNVTISGGTVTAMDGMAGIYAVENITISGGTVTAMGDTLGISAHSITISGGTVTAMGGTMGIYDYGGIIISPQSNQQIAVTAGVDKNGATAIYGSPFRGETDIGDLIDEAAYFHSETSARTSSGGGGGGSGNNTETEKNPDGSTTTTVTKPDGSTTETTKWPDGSKEVIETKKDGTVTTTTTDKDGNQTEVVENPDGSSKTTVDNKDGSSSVTTVDEDGKIEAEVKLPADLVEDAQEKGEAVTLPMPEVPVTTDRDEAPTVTVDLPSGTAVQVEIPVKRVTSGTVAVLVKDNGTEEVIKTSLTTENGVAITLSDGDTVKIVDNSKTFTDVPSSYWGSEYIDFVTSREIFSGTGSSTFSPDASMTRGMIVTVLAAYDGADTSSNGGAWYEAGRQWAMANGISDGTNMDGALTREQLAVMLWNYAGKPAAGSLSGYTDAASVSDWAMQAMAWCVEQGVISGMDGGLNPQGTATRAQVATMLMQFCQLGK